MLSGGEAIGTGARRTFSKLRRWIRGMLIYFRNMRVRMFVFVVFPKAWLSLSEARNELESFLKEQPENCVVMGDLALTNMALGNNSAAMILADRAIAMIPIEKDALTGPRPLDILARVAARVGDSNRAISALEKLLSIPYEAPLAANPPLTPALLRLDPMFESLRNDPRFQKLIASSGAR